MSAKPESLFELDQKVAGGEPDLRYLDTAVSDAVQALLRLQQDEGSWCWELESDCTIPAEYILMNHFTGEVEEALESAIATRLRASQAEHGGWPLYYGGAFDLSCSVKAYYALKLCGDEPNAPHMRRARTAILAHGGAVRCNVFTRITLALFRQIPWRGVPFIPVEHILLPRWFPFHISKISYWSRTVLVPLAVLCSCKPAAVNPRRLGIPELFRVPPSQERTYFQAKGLLDHLFLAWDHIARRFEPLIPKALRARALRASADWILPRLNGKHGLGGIFPAMVNTYEALPLLGYPSDHPYRKQTREAIRNLLIRHPDGSVSCQPCVSPVWDTALAGLALAAVDPETYRIPLVRAMDWLRTQQLLDEPGDWREKHPKLAGGGWSFQFGNDYYPDLDDTPMVTWAMQETDAKRYKDSIERAAEWVRGMQSKNGGYGSFDSDNNCYYLNHIPFADHGALLDPPTSDVTARCLILLRRAPGPGRAAAASRALSYLWREQEKDGSWFGRWGTNYIYGSFSVLSALEQAGISPQDPRVRRTVDWLKKIQHPDGSWGESNDSYLRSGPPTCPGSGTPFQTAWALLGLMATDETHSEAVHRGIQYLLNTQQKDALWHSKEFTAPGFPRVFYLHYHGYNKYFPLWALGRYRHLVRHRPKPS